ncbi:Rieske 2Fe-2S domain-containing protein [Sinorhizobium meliloti]|nr:Rieske 2Fe-2S domain-containing protein [Sinorhizobium meliloti]
MLTGEFQPLCLVSKIGRQPVAASVAGEDFVVFRGDEGRIGVLIDRCPHRGMRLSRGRVTGGTLECPYHGWRFDVNGCGQSPANPGITPRARAVEVTEAGGVVWIRRPRPDSTPLPSLDMSGFQLIHRAFCDIDAPMLAVLDNFTEIEHTGTGHWEFGFDEQRLDQVQFTTDIGPHRASARAEGFQKHLSLPSRLALGLRHGDRLTITIDVTYAPLHVRYAWWWTDRESGKRTGPEFREIAFFAPIYERRSRLVAYYFWTGGRTGLPFGIGNVLRTAAAQVIRYEIALDIRLCTSLVPGAESLSGCHLTRFDALVRAHRNNLSKGKPRGPKASD